MTTSAKRRLARSRPRRRGVEIVELAFTLPIMVVLVFGTLETCELLFTKQSLAVAAYEAARVAARPEGTAAAAQTRFEQIMTSRRVDNATFTITPSNLASIEVGETIEIDVTAPVLGNSTTNLVLIGVPDLIERVVVVRE